MKIKVPLEKPLYLGNPTLPVTRAAISLLATMEVEVDTNDPDSPEAVEVLARTYWYLLQLTLQHYMPHDNLCLPITLRRMDKTGENLKQTVLAYANYNHRPVWHAVRDVSLNVTGATAEQVKVAYRVLCTLAASPEATPVEAA